MGFERILFDCRSAIKKGSASLVRKTGIGRRISKGIEEGRDAAVIQFKGLESNNAALLDSYKASISAKAQDAAIKTMNDNEFMSVLRRFSEKNNLTTDRLPNMSEEEILEMILQKSGVGPCKFAQIISSDESMMSRFSPNIQDLIKKTQSENKFSRTVSEAQRIVDNSFNTKQLEVLPKSQGVSTPLTLLNDSSVKIIKPLSAGTVGETYLARTADGKEVIVKMIKQNVDKEQLELEEKIFKRFIQEFAPDNLTSQKQINMLENLYKDWGKELNFKYEYEYNKLLQQGAKRYHVADITRIADDGSCILMEKAPGIQMNNLMKMLKDYKKNPSEFKTKYAKEIEENPWLADPKQVIKNLPETITKAFDEMFLFMKKDGSSMMHGDPHMGNYFINAANDGKLIPVFIDTGNCISRNAHQIQEDLKFLTNYFVGNSKGIAKYFVKQCEQDQNYIAKILQTEKLLPSGKDPESFLIDKIAKEIQEAVFAKKQNITSVDAVQKTIQTILENNGLSMKPEAATAIKAQMQFFTGITEAASLSGKKVDVGTIMKDIPEALLDMIKSRTNPFATVKDALSFAYKNQQQASRSVYQFLSPPKNSLKLTELIQPEYKHSLQPVYISA